MSSYYSHEREIESFFRKCRNEDMDKYTEVAKKFPVNSQSKLKRLKVKEQTVGLMGLQPANLPISLAFELGYESIHLKEDE